MQYSTEKQEIHELRQNARIMVRELGLLKDAYFDIGVTLAMRHLLIELESSLYPSVNEVAKKLLLDKSSASRLIARAVKKGYVAYVIDERDKRKKCLQLTEEGLRTLLAFESIAQDQVKDALDTLSDKEVQKIKEGMSYFAKGLQTVRRRKEFLIETVTQNDNPSLAHLFESSPLTEKYASRDRELSTMFETYSQKGYFYLVVKKNSNTVSGAGIAPYKEGSPAECEMQKIHIDPELAELGLDVILIETVLNQAAQLGYSKCFVRTGMGLHPLKDLLVQVGFQEEVSRQEETESYFVKNLIPHI